MRARGAALASVFELVFHRLRLSEPWRYKAPFLISVPYFLLFAGAAPFTEALAGIGWALCTIVGIAGFGYFSNDVSDRKADRAAGRPNGTAELSVSQTTLAFAFLLAAAAAPWLLYLPLDGVALGLLIAEFVLFLVYSVPPFRLKERGIAGLLADALYAHAVPALLAAWTFHVLTGRRYADFPAFVIALGSWQLFAGLRNVLTHQLADEDNDRRAGTATYVILRGREASTRLLEYVLAPLELATWAGFTAVAAATMPALGVAWLAAVLLMGRIHFAQPREPLPDRLGRLLNEYYLRWMPLVILLGLCIRDPRMSVLALLHLAIFQNGLTTVLCRAWRARMARWRQPGQVHREDELT